MIDWSERRGKWERDEFGLPFKPKGEESARDRVLREAEMREVAHINLSAIYRRLQAGLGGGTDGVRKARLCFDSFASQKKRYSKGQHGADDEKTDRLMRFYDVYGNSYESLSVFANSLHSELRGEFGATPEAIEKRLRGQLKKREENAAKK
jgi:hypothetical protein